MSESGYSCLAATAGVHLGFRRPQLRQSSLLPTSYKKDKSVNVLKTKKIQCKNKQCKKYMLHKVTQYKMDHIGTKTAFQIRNQAQNSLPSLRAEIVLSRKLKVPFEITMMFEQ
ncbi:60S ribosomal protein L36a [Platanthera guangdongensis]|uniref:60S ribosomal protein L36a n=1 Tax=Platanthera guangdongensis TaxID=2320717 RepID=A0ABR2MIS0_9ASPA